MLRFAQKLSDNMKKITSALISEINESEELSSEKMMKFCFFFKTCNSFLKTSALFWINLSSWSWRNWVWQCNWHFLVSAAWKALNKHCFSLERAVCSFSIFSQALSNHMTFTVRKLKNSEHDFFKWTHSLHLLNLSEMM